MNAPHANGPTGSAPLIDLNLEDVWPILRKQRQVVGLFLGVVVVATLVFSLLTTPEYRAQATIHLSPRAGQEVAVNEVVDLNTRGYFETQQFFRTQIQLILSRTVREQVLERYAAAGFDDLPLDDGGIDKLARILQVTPEEQSSLLTIYVTHEDPVRAKVLANLVAETYSDRNLASRRDASSNATAWLEQQLDDYADKVDDANQALFAFKTETTMVDVAERINTLGARIEALNAAYGQRSTELVVARTEYQAHQALWNKGAWDDLARVLQSPVLEAATRDWLTAEAQVADLSARYGPKHPERLQADARVANALELVRTEVRRLLDGEAARVTVLDQSVKSLQAEIDTVKQQMLDYQRRVTEYDALQGELTRLEGFYDRLSDRLEEVRLTSQTQLNNVQLVDAAVVPTSPYKPNIPMSLAVALIVGLVGGVGLALLREYVDDTISSQLDVVAHLKVPFLGLVPRLPEGVSGQEADLFTHHNPRSSVAEAVRGLRAMIEMNPNGPSPRRLLVTSSVAREGKTSTSLRLGVSFAQMGRKVVLIDADMRRPRVHKVFGHDPTVGLSSYLVGAAEVDDLPHATPVPNLYTIYAGSQTEHPAELMASDRMETLLSALEDRFDILILDTPPSVALSDAVTLSRRVDGILLVVKEQSVSRQVVKQTLDQLRQVEANILGVVLNNVDLQRGGSQYKYYYAYRDDYATYAAPDPGGEDKVAK